MKLADSAARSLEATTRQAAKALTELSRTASRLSTQNTSTLCGVAGGFIGMSVAYGLSLTFPISLPVAAFLLCGVGVSGGVLAYRGSRGVDIEKRLDLNRMAVDEVLDRIKKLPKDAPPEVRKQLWDTYQSLNAAPQLGSALSPAVAALPAPQVNLSQLPVANQQVSKVPVDRKDA